MGSGIEKLIIKPGEEKDYHAVAVPEDRRTDAEKRFDARLSEKVCVLFPFTCFPFLSYIGKGIH